jgi:EAL domain-containing protein (putative c-di-GMP-specific phosphodiesterase class I)
VTLSTLRILVLEDQPLQRYALVASLRQLGCANILEAADGVQALGLLQEHGPVDIAFCDICMAGMDGLSFLRHASERKWINAVIINSELAADLRQTIASMVELSGMQLLGELAKAAKVPALKQLLGRYNRLSLPHSHGLPDQHVFTDTEVREALEAGQFQVHCQPKFNLNTLEVDSLEALARWNHPKQGLLPPAVFLPILERLGLLDRLLYQQIEQCLGLRAQAKAYGYDFKFSINIQTFQLANEQLSTEIIRRLALFEAPGNCLCLEITETDPRALTPASLENLVRIRMAGCGLSIDDFGTGHSSLQRLCQLPFNEVKLDATFTRELKRSPRSSAAISSTLQLAAALGMSVVVEGIETLEQRDLLLSLGCKIGQGYFFAKPMAPDKLLIWLLNKTIQDDFGVIRDRLLSSQPCVRSALSS